MNTTENKEINTAPAETSAPASVPDREPDYGFNADYCVMCGEVIPEGRTVCKRCENEALHGGGGGS